MKEFDENVILETEHLILRFPRKEDREDLFQNINHDRDVLRYYVDSYCEKVEDYDIEKMIKSFTNKEMYVFSIILKENGEVIGLIHQCNKANKVMNTIEVGYAIGKKYWNMGYVTEAMKVMIDLLFEKGVHKVTACHITENKASGRVMEKCGMMYEGKVIDEIFYRDKYWDTLHYYILNKGE